MPRKPRPFRWYSIANGGNETGDAVKATCQSTANRKIARYQRRLGSRYYLMFPISYEGNEHKYIEVERDPVNQPASPQAARRKKTAHADASQIRMMHNQHLD